MRISIAMIAEKLPELNPEAHIVTGGRTLRSARLLSDSQARSPSVLYLQQNSPNTIACVNGNDVLFLHSDDLDRTLNAILDVFDGFNDWHEEAKGLVMGGGSLHDVLVSIAQKMDAHLIVADATYLIRDWAMGETEFESPTLKEFYRARSMPLDVILRIDADPKVRQKGAGVYYEQFDENNVSIVCNVFVEGEHRGWLVANRTANVYSPGDFDFLEIAAGLVEWWMRDNQEQDDRWEQTALLRQLAEGRAPDPALVERALLVYGWTGTDALRAYAVQQDALSKRPLFVVERFLAQVVPHSFVLRMDEGLLAVANESLADEPSYRPEIVQVLRTCGFHAGRSPLFRDIVGLSSQYASALVAASLADEENPLVAFEDVKLPYALSVLRLNTVADVRHGALDVLSAYDSAHGTQLYETLKCFVGNRGGYARTYHQLFIHRTTLQYRLERIVELCELDLDDPATWAHLQLSFLLDE